MKFNVVYKLPCQFFSQAQNKAFHFIVLWALTDLWSNLQISKNLKSPIHSSGQSYASRLPTPPSWVYNVSLTFSKKICLSQVALCIMVVLDVKHSTRRIVRNTTKIWLHICIFVHQIMEIYYVSMIKSSSSWKDIFQECPIFTRFCILRFSMILMSEILVCITVFIRLNSILTLRSNQGGAVL